jgi:hypothetical protein
MDLIDRYLDTVRLMLPFGQRDDIVAELRDLLMSRREEQEAVLGRPLTRKENEDLLRGFGHPIVVAARYGRQQYMIGPELYPLYALVLKLVVASVAFAAVVTGVVLAAVAPGDIHHAIGTAASIVWTGGFASVGAVTLVFAAMQRTGAGAKLLDNWRVDELPRLGRRARRAPAWLDPIANIIVQVLFLLWWTGVLPFGWAVIEAEPHGVIHLGLAPVWHTLYWPVIWLALAAIVFNAIKLAFPRRQRLGHALDILAHAGMAGLAAFALTAGRWAVVTGIDIPASALAKVEKGVNVGAEIALIVVVVASVGAILKSAWRLARPEAGAAAPSGGHARL